MSGRRYSFRIANNRRLWRAFGRELREDGPEGELVRHVRYRQLLIDAYGRGMRRAAMRVAYRRRR